MTGPLDGNGQLALVLGTGAGHAADVYKRQKLGVMQAQVETALRHPDIGAEFHAYLKELARTL